jgi:hypothetical protein
MRRIRRFTQAPAGVAGVALPLTLLLPLAAGTDPPEPGEVPGALVVREARISHGPGGTQPGTVRLEVAERQTGDAADVIRLQALLTGPLAGDAAQDLYAFNAVLRFSSQRLAYVDGSVRKGDLLGRDGRDSLITAGVTPGAETRLTVGASRLGRVAGVVAPEGRAVLFNLDLRVLMPGDTPLSWEDSSFIDSRLRRVDAARFVGGTLQVATEPAPAMGKEN